MVAQSSTATLLSWASILAGNTVVSVASCKACHVSEDDIWVHVNTHILAQQWLTLLASKKSRTPTWLRTSHWIFYYLSCRQKWSFFVLMRSHPVSLSNSSLFPLKRLGNPFWDCDIVRTIYWSLSLVLGTKFLKTLKFPKWEGREEHLLLSIISHFQPYLSLYH